MTSNIQHPRLPKIDFSAMLKFLRCQVCEEIPLVNHWLIKLTADAPPTSKLTLDTNKVLSAAMPILNVNYVKRFFFFKPGFIFIFFMFFGILNCSYLFLLKIYLSIGILDIMPSLKIYNAKDQGLFRSKKKKKKKISRFTKK